MASREQQFTGQAPWESPIPLSGAHQLPRFPTEVLPGWQRAFVEAEATFTQTPEDLAGMLVLAATAVACQGKAKVQVKPGYAEPLNLFILIAMASGERKSPVFAAAFRPHLDYEVAMATRSDAIASEDGAQGTPITRSRLFADDVTPEALVRLLAENDGNLSVVSDEGGIFDTLAGRYGKAVANLDAVLKAYTGTPIRVDRVGRPTLWIPNSCLTLALTVQPDVIRGLGTNPSFRGRGLLARIMYSVPRSLVGQREVSPPAVPEAVLAVYGRRMQDLLELPDVEVPQAMTMMPEALGLLEDFLRWREPRLVDTGDLNEIKDWAEKSSGTVARIAGLLHLADHAGQHPKPWEVPVPTDTMDRAVALVRYLIPHAQEAFSVMAPDRSLAGATRLLSWIQRARVTTFKKKEAFDANRFFEKAAALDGPLDMLERHRYIRLRPEPARTGAGRRPSPVYDVNPMVLGNPPRNPHNPPDDIGPGPADPAADSGASEDSADSADSAEGVVEETSSNIIVRGAAGFSLRVPTANLRQTLKIVGSKTGSGGAFRGLLRVVSEGTWLALRLTNVSSRCTLDTEVAASGEAQVGASCELCHPRFSALLRSAGDAVELTWDGDGKVAARISTLGIAEPVPSGLEAVNWKFPDISSARLVRSVPSDELLWAFETCSSIPKVAAFGPNVRMVADGRVASKQDQRVTLFDATEAHNEVCIEGDSIPGFQKFLRGVRETTVDLLSLPRGAPSKATLAPADATGTILVVRSGGTLLWRDVYSPKTASKTGDKLGTSETWCEVGRADFLSALERIASFGDGYSCICIATSKDRSTVDVFGEGSSIPHDPNSPAVRVPVRSSHGDEPVPTVSVSLKTVLQAVHAQAHGLVQLRVEVPRPGRAVLSFRHGERIVAVPGLIVATAVPASVA